MTAVPDRAAPRGAHPDDVGYGPVLQRSVRDELADHLGRTERAHGLTQGRLAESYRVVDTA